MTLRITLRRPDDWHVHLRDGEALARTVTDIARCFRRIIVMPNLRPPVVTTADALAYRERVMAALLSCDVASRTTYGLAEHAHYQLLERSTLQLARSRLRLRRRADGADV